MTTIKSKKQTINLTTVVFDEKLKRFILDAKNRVDLTSLFSSKSKHADMLDTQEDMLNIQLNMIKNLMDRLESVLFITH